MTILNLAENGARCDCGSSALGPQTLEAGELCICARCGRTYRVQPVELVAVPWSDAARVLDQDTFEQFEWIRGGIAPECLRDAACAARAFDVRAAFFALSLSALVVAAARVFS